MEIEISKEFKFEASHLLPDHPGVCARLHGHSYRGKVIVSSLKLNDAGMVMDYHDLKKIINKVIVDKYDHIHLNDFFKNPTAEIMVRYLFEEFNKELSKGYPDVILKKIILKETANSEAIATI